MKKQLHKIKIAAENFSRPTKPDKNSEELLTADRQVELYKDVLEKISKKFSTNASPSGSGSDQQDPAAREKRCKKVHEYRLAQAMEESLKDLPDGLLRKVLDNCAKLEKNIASDIIDTECSVEQDVTKKLTNIMDKHIVTIQKQKRTVTKLMQENESAKHRHQAAQRINENQAKITQLREEQEEWETKLEKERDIWAAEMFELIAEEENMSNYIINYIKHQQLYYKSALKQIEEVMERVNGLMKGNNKRIYKVPLDDHLAVSDRKISYVIELCVCCLLEKGLYEEGLLRVGCAGSKLRRFRSAIDANVIVPPFPIEYQDVHVIASVLKSYLRDLPDPLLTYQLYDEFVSAAQRPTEDKRKKAILNAVNQLPTGHYLNLRYLTKFLSILAQKHQYNKMSSQNIAIVMSPNLLWPPDSIETDYVQKVNSAAAINTIVELLVSDWSFFFEGDIDFYLTMTRDDLFPDNGGFAYDRDPLSDSMTKSMHVMGSGSLATSGNGTNDTMSVSQYQTHSRSSSHDTSLILLGGGGGGSGGSSGFGAAAHEQIKRSQSSSSVSDTSSPPQQSSPKLPVRRKHNKPAAPTPPETKYPTAMVRSSQFTEQHLTKLAKYQQDQDDDVAQQQQLSSLQHQLHHMDIMSSQQHQERPQKPPLATRRFFDSNDNLAKPDKPPRPVLVSTECQTLNRIQYRSAKESDRSRKPIVQPKSMLFVNRSTENLTDKHMGASEEDGFYDPVAVGTRDQPASEEEGYYDEVPITFREKADSDGGDRPAKPAIPERPMSLMRPPSYKSGSVPDNSQHHAIVPNSVDQPLKKTQSFRGNTATQTTTTMANSKTLNGGGNNGSLTTLERTHIYNVDKKQVAIIDFVDTSSSSVTAGKHDVTPPVHKQAASASHDEKRPPPPLLGIAATATSSNEHVTADNSTLSNSIGVSGQAPMTVPPSPRGFDPKIKRPQIPAPPPPTNRPKSDGGSATPGDSTNL